MKKFLLTVAAMMTLAAPAMAQSVGDSCGYVLWYSSFSAAEKDAIKTWGKQGDRLAVRNTRVFSTNNPAIWYLEFTAQNQTELNAINTRIASGKVILIQCLAGERDHYQDYDSLDRILGWGYTMTQRYP